MIIINRKLEFIAVGEIFFVQGTENIKKIIPEFDNMTDEEVKLYIAEEVLN